ncbi:hypothetical protein IE53DRAFT_15579 [Violaceomyces palustris]|uniref:Uncharacterized protein n=1 Tax=Violaceomyces palustris TaxID=1673888 RepID=A0ACD0P1Z9_9BASI|nr:hypothetical protein IE53DRAFT_15579 [Violaceomyces palustris]
MDPFATYAHIENSQQFWSELEDVLGVQLPSTAGLDQAEALELRRSHAVSVLDNFLTLCEACFNGNLESQYNQDYCISRLFDSMVFRDQVMDHPDQARSATSTFPMHQLAAEAALAITQKATSLPILVLSYEIVLQYGQAESSVYRTLQNQAQKSPSSIRPFLHRLVHQVWAGFYAAQAESRLNALSVDSHDKTSGWQGAHWNDRGESVEIKPPLATAPAEGSNAARDRSLQISLREKAVRMLYEVCRVQKLEKTDLKAFDARFINHLFDLVEETRHHHDEGFNYQLIKLIVAMNEQFMVSGLNAPPARAVAGDSSGVQSAPITNTRPTNAVLEVLKDRLNASKTFGENLIFMLNRASSSDDEDLCMQLLVLKLLYLLFTTKETACYFYTNDLKVLVDIFIRELSDLPDESESLRHTYLRVLHPLLTNTQLCTYPYKRPQIRRLLTGLLSHSHLRDISSTTRRLVERCLKAEWCVELDRLDGTSAVASVAPIGGGEAHSKRMVGGVTNEGLPMLSTDIKVSSASVDCPVAVAERVGEAEGRFSVDSSTPSGDGIRPEFSATSGSGDAILAIPPHIKTRGKRVLSLSNPKTMFAYLDIEPVARPSSQEGFARRVASVQSLPSTPPRVDSPGLSAEEDANSEGLSTASSWHAHMAENPNPRPSGKVEKSRAHSSSTLSPSAAVHHPYLHHSSTEALPATARVGSPLALEATAYYSMPDACKPAQCADSPNRDETSDGPRIPSLHAQDASNETITNEKEEQTASSGRRNKGAVRCEDAMMENSTYYSTHDNDPMILPIDSFTCPMATVPPTRRRKPPQPPELAGTSIDRERPGRKALATSVSEHFAPHVAQGRVECLTDCSSGSISRPDSPQRTTSLPVSASPPRASTMAMASNASTRRRPPPPPSTASKPPPPPVNRATKSNNLGNVTSSGSQARVAGASIQDRQDSQERSRSATPEVYNRRIVELDGPGESFTIARKDDEAVVDDLTNMASQSLRVG